jgi:hypothetical protein
MRVLPWLLGLALALAACDGGLTPFEEREGTGRAFGPCDVPIPDHVEIPHKIWGVAPVHFYVPHARWALATAHASSRLLQLQADGLDLHLSPSFLFAIALKESFLGCDETTTADPVHPQHAYPRLVATDPNGCFGITTVTWDEMCRMYPAQLDCSVLTHGAVISASDQTTTGRSNFEPGAHLFTLAATFGYAMITKHGISDPDAWLAAAQDPHAREKIVALIYNQSAWSSAIGDILSGCQDKPLESCLSPGSAVEDYVKSVAAYTEILEAGVEQQSCYNAYITTADVASYLDRIEAIFPDEDWPALRTEALKTFVKASGGATSAPFQQVARPLLDLLDSKINTRLRCPAGPLDTWYQHTCPN